MKDFFELQKYLEREMFEKNNRGISDFEGYSPNEMQTILYDPFGKNSPIQLSKLPEFEYNKIPILNQIKYLLNIIKESGELKLTAKGHLPTKIVSEIYNQGFIKDELIESGIYKLYKETDAISINLTRILSEISGIVKKRHNKLSLTKKGIEQLSNNHALLKNIFTSFGVKFNWAYFDRYGNHQLGQLGYGFTLILLSKYGSHQKHYTFYANKYFAAFPRTIDFIEEWDIEYKLKTASNCYSLRSFERFLDYFGIVKLISEKKWDSDIYIVKTDLYDKLIKIKPHKEIKC